MTEQAVAGLVPQRPLAAISAKPAAPGGPAQGFEQGLTSPICLTWELPFVCNPVRPSSLAWT